MRERNRQRHSTVNLTRLVVRLECLTNCSSATKRIVFNSKCRRGRVPNKSDDWMKESSRGTKKVEEMRKHQSIALHFVSSSFCHSFTSIFSTVGLADKELQASTRLHLDDYINKAPLIRWRCKVSGRETQRAEFAIQYFSIIHSADEEGDEQQIKSIGNSCSWGLAPAKDGMRRITEIRWFYPIFQAISANISPSLNRIFLGRRRRWMTACPEFNYTCALAISRNRFFSPASRGEAKISYVQEMCCGQNC